MDTQAPPAVRWVAVALVVAAAATVLGVIALWPRGDAPDLGRQPNTFVDATVTGISHETCPQVEVDALGDCQIVQAELTSGPDSGDGVSFQVRATQFDIPELAVDDKVVLLDVASSPAEFRYSFEDFQRSTPLLWLVGAFAVVVVAFGRWLGVRALIGLAATGLVIVAFLVPALLRDQPALPVALAAGAVIAFASLYLAHGINRATSVALAGTLASLAVTAGLAVLAVNVTRLTGLTEERATTLRVTAEALDLRGLLIAAIVIGALGVLDDITVSQVSTVAALRRANPTLGAVRLYREAIRVGRDHVAAVVNTLVLAYVGAALPLLLFFTQGDRPVSRLLTDEIVATEAVRILVGSMGLILAVPITTALAAVALAPTDDADVAPRASGSPDHALRTAGLGAGPLREPGAPAPGPPSRRPVPTPGAPSPAPPAGASAPGATAPTWQWPPSASSLPDRPPEGEGEAEADRATRERRREEIWDDFTPRDWRW